MELSDTRPYGGAADHEGPRQMASATPSSIEGCSVGRRALASDHWGSGRACARSRKSKSRFKVREGMQAVGVAVTLPRERPTSCPTGLMSGRIPTDPHSAGAEPRASLTGGNDSLASARQSSFPEVRTTTRSTRSAASTHDDNDGLERRGVPSPLHALGMPFCTRGPSAGSGGRGPN